MRMRLTLALGACTVVLMIGAGSARAANGPYGLSLESAVGRSELSSEGFRYSTELDARTVVRQSMAVVRSLGDHALGSVEVAWLQRGATDRVRTVYRPEGEGRALSFERTYLDVGFPVSYRLRRTHAYLGAGLSPRLSFLVGTKSSPIPAKYDNGPLIGLDPSITAGYRFAHVTARYLYDLVSPQVISSSTSKVEISDKVFFIGLGCDIAL